MSKVFIEESTLTAIGDAIRGKTGATELIAPLDMPSEIEGIVGGGGGDNEKFIDLVETDITTITKQELKGCTKFGDGAFEYCKQLRSIEIPDTVTTIGQYCFANTVLTELTIPPKVTKLGNSLVNNIRNLERVTLLCESVPDNTSGMSFATTGTIIPKQILVRGELLDEYLQHGDWKRYANVLGPYNEYCSVPASSHILEFGKTLNITIPISNFDYVPEYSITANNSSLLISNIVASNSSLSFDVAANGVEGEVVVTITITTSSGFIFTRTININVVSELVYPTWTVESVEGAAYGFELNENGFYESTNKGVQNSFAFCKVVFNNPMNFPIYIDCINYGESGYDYGLLSRVNESFSLNISPDGPIYHDFKSMSIPDIQTVSYTNLSGDCFITIKYRKDSSNDKNNDSLQFKIRYE